MPAMAPKTRTAKETFATTTPHRPAQRHQRVGQPDGGQLLNWMDIASAISANRHCRRVVVTAAVNNVSFDQPIRLGDMVTIEAKVSRAFTSSMEVFMEVFVEDNATGKRSRATKRCTPSSPSTSLARPSWCRSLVPESEEEQRRFEGALRRRQLRLILAGKMKPADATELKALFSMPMFAATRIRCGDTRRMHGVR